MLLCTLKLGLVESNTHNSVTVSWSTKLLRSSISTEAQTKIVVSQKKKKLKAKLSTEDGTDVFQSPKDLHYDTAVQAYYEPYLYRHYKHHWIGCPDGSNGRAAYTVP